MTPEQQAVIVAELTAALYNDPDPLHEVASRMNRVFRQHPEWSSLGPLTIRLDVAAPLDVEGVAQPGEDPRTRVCRMLDVHEWAAWPLAPSPHAHTLGGMPITTEGSPRKARDLQPDDTISYGSGPLRVRSIQQVSCQVWVTVSPIPDDGEQFEIPAPFPEGYEFPILTGTVVGRDGALYQATASQATIDARPHQPAGETTDS